MAGRMGWHSLPGLISSRVLLSPLDHWFALSQRHPPDDGFWVVSAKVPEHGIANEVQTFSANFFVIDRRKEVVRVKEEYAVFLRMKFREMMPRQLRHGFPVSSETILLFRRGREDSIDILGKPYFPYQSITLP